MVPTEEWQRVRALLMELSLKLQWQWVLRRKGWQDQDPLFEKAAEYAGMRTTNYMRVLCHTEPWLSWEVAEGTEDIVLCLPLGIICIPPAGTVFKWALAPAAPTGWCPAEPPKPAPSELGKPRGGRFL